MNALEKINVAILLITISYAILIHNVITASGTVEPAIGWGITFLTSVGLFRLLIILIFWALRTSDTLLAIYHRGRFLKGLWIYRYDIDGEDHVGIWRVQQDLASISITGYGLNPKGKIDSHFRSISELFEHQGADEIMFARTDVESGDEHFAKTTLYVDRFSQRKLATGPTSMRVGSVLYGHQEAGARHADITLRRVTRGQSEAQAVETLIAETPNQP